MNIATRPGGVGLALLLRDGLPGWIKGVEAIMHLSGAPRTESPQPQAPDPDARSGTTTAGLTHGQRQDITAILTSLVLSTRCVPSASSAEEYRSCQ
jgi:hypothetical protein